MHGPFSTIIVTLNQPVALALSLSLYLAQSRLPELVLFVGSTDYPSEIREGKSVINVLIRAYVVLRSGVADKGIKAPIDHTLGSGLPQFTVWARREWGLDRLSGARAA